MSKACCFYCQVSPSKIQGLTFHRFPKDVALRNSWLKACGYSENDYAPERKICSLHFEANCYKTTKVRKLLLPGAVPTKFKKIAKNLFVDGSKYNIVYNSPCGMKCCFPGCSSKQKYAAFLSPRSYFSFPKDSSRCSVWLKQCKIKSIMSIDPVVLNRKYRLCSLHFEDKMFSNYQKNRLKPNAIPKIFVHLSKEVSTDRQLFQVPLNNSCNGENIPSCSTSIADLSTNIMSATTLDASTPSKNLFCDKISRSIIMDHNYAVQDSSIINMPATTLDDASTPSENLFCDMIHRSIIMDHNYAVQVNRLNEQAAVTYITLPSV